MLPVFPVVIRLHQFAMTHLESGLQSLRWSYFVGLIYPEFSSLCFVIRVCAMCLYSRSDVIRTRNTYTLTIKSDKWGNKPVCVREISCTEWSGCGTCSLSGIRPKWNALVNFANLVLTYLHLSCAAIPDAIVAMAPTSRDIDILSWGFFVSETVEIIIVLMVSFILLEVFEISGFANWAFNLATADGCGVRMPGTVWLVD